MHLGRAFATISHACGGPSALTWWAWLITLPLSVGVALSPEGVEPTRSLWAGALAAVITQVVLIPAFVIARWWLRHRRPVSAVLSIYAGLGALRGLGVVTIQQLIAPADDLGLIGRVAVSAALAVVGLVTIAVVIDRIRTYRAARQRLLNAVGRVSAIGPVPGQLAAVESALSDLAMESGMTAHELATRIQHLINDEVRPLSHRLLADPGDGVDPTPAQSPAPRMRLRLPPPNPWLVALALEGGALVAVARHVGFVTALVNAVVTGLVIAGIGFALNWGIRRLAGASRVAALVLIAIAYAGVGVVAMLMSDGIFRLFGYVEPFYVTAIPFAAVWAILVSVATGADREAQAAEEQLAGLLRQEIIDATVSRVNAQAVARRMHGGLQGDLTATMMALRHDTSPLDVDEAQARLLSISRSLVPSLAPDTQPDARATGDEIDSFVEVWSQALDVEWHIDGDCRTRLTQDRQAWSRVRTVVMEGLTNVVRHAPAATAVVHVADVDGVMRVEVTSPGVLSVTDPGVGIRGLRESFDAVDLQQRDGHVLLSVIVTPDPRAGAAIP